MLTKMLSVKKVALLISFLLFSAQNVLAQNVSTKSYEAALVVPWSFLNNTFGQSDDGSQKNYQIPVSRFDVMVQDIPVEISAGQLDLQLKLKDIVVDRFSTLWSSESLAMQLQIQGLRVSKEIIRNIGGVQVVANIQAQCQPFVIAIDQSHVDMKWDWTVIDGKIQARLSEIALDYVDASLRISPISCEGPEGFGELVQKSISEQLLQKDVLISNFRSKIENYFNDKINSELAKLEKPQWISESKNIQFHLIGSSFVINKGAFFRALVTVGDVSQPSSDVEPLSLDEEVLSSVSDLPAFIFSNKAIQDIVSQKKDWFSLNISLNSVSGFAKLLKSRFLQFFLWPDLWHYSRSSPFRLKMQQSSEANLVLMQNKFSISAPLNSWIVSERKGQSWNYILIKSNLKSSGDILMQDGKLKLQISNLQIPSKFSFGEDYVKRFSPVRYFAGSILQNVLEQSLQGSQQVVQLPELTLGEGYSLKAKQLKSVKDCSVIEFSL